jgi:hypothetical protein
MAVNGSGHVLTREQFLAAPGATGGLSNSVFAMDRLTVGI